MGDVPVTLFDAIGPEPARTPSTRPRTGITARSAADQRIMRTVAKANPHAAERDLTRRLDKPTVRKTKILSAKECQQQASLIATLAFEAIESQVLDGLPLSSADRKNLGVLWGVSQDKLRTWREVPDVTPTTPPDLRPGIRDLIRRLVEAERAPP